MSLSIENNLRIVFTVDDIEYVTAEIDLEGINENKKYTVNLKKPLGVRHQGERKEETVIN